MRNPFQEICKFHRIIYVPLNKICKSTVFADHVFPAKSHNLQFCPYKGKHRLQKPVFSHILRVDVHCVRNNYNQANEFVFHSVFICARTDIALLSNIQMTKPYLIIYSTLSCSNRDSNFFNIH